MNADARNELMAVLTEIGRVAPYLRLGQLLCILADRAEHPYTAYPVADIEDAELLPAAREFLSLMRSLPAELHDAEARAHMPASIRAAG